MDLKKKNFIKAYKKSYGNISESCRAVSISRTAYYKWMKTDEEFKSEIEGVQPDEDFLDFLEHKAKERIEEGSDSVLIFALKAKGKSRGWIEKQIIENQDTIFANIEIIEDDGEAESQTDNKEQSNI